MPILIDLPLVVSSLELVALCRLEGVFPIVKSVLEDAPDVTRSLGMRNVGSSDFQLFSFELSLPETTRPRTFTMADKLRTQQQLESLQNKYIGTGHADTTKHEWTSNIARDSYASYQGHPPLLHYMAIGMGMPMEKVRMQCMEKMVLPVGPAPERDGAS